jgi:uncharacterized protein YndB with AHSA1/START domain
MKKSLLMNFEVDKQKKRIVVQREFAATRDKVWAAWTRQDLLDRWWAPSPWKARTGSMDFSEGGYWLYAMVGPEGEEHWARADYQTISPPDSFTAKDSFCDADGNIDDTLPKNYWNVRFIDQNETTLVEIELSFESLEDLEKIIEMGFQEGFTSGLENLDRLLGTVRE